MNSQIVFTSAFGAKRYSAMALGLGRSLRLIGDSTYRVVMTDQPDVSWKPAFDHLIYKQVEPSELWWSKLDALRETDAEQILFLDADSLAFRRLDPVFEAFEGASFGIQGSWISSGEWYGADLAEVCRKEGVEAIPQFNAGLLYYTRDAECQELLAEARRVAARAESLGFRSPRGVPSEEVCFSLAIARTGLGRVLPDTVDFSNSGVGMVGRLRMDVRRAQCEYLCRRYELRHVQPFVFHAHLYSKYLIYWRQLRILEKLEQYEQRHGFGYLSPGKKFSRSIQKRLIKLLYKS